MSSPPNPPGTKLSIYLPGPVATEIDMTAKYFGVAMSKVIRDAWMLARQYHGDPIPNTLLPFPSLLRSAIERRTQDAKKG